MRRLLFSFGFLLLALSLAGCGNGGVGDTCQSAGINDDCNDGLICTQQPASMVEPGAPNSVRSFCRTLCDENIDCVGEGEGFTCRRAPSTSFLSCQPPDEDPM